MLFYTLMHNIFSYLLFTSLLKGFATLLYCTEQAHPVITTHHSSPLRDTDAAKTLEQRRTQRTDPFSTGNSRFQDNVNKRAVKRIRKHAWYSKKFADCISGPPTLSAGRPLLDYSLIACGAVHVLVPNIRNGTGSRGILELKNTKELMNRIICYSARVVTFIYW